MIFKAQATPNLINILLTHPSINTILKLSGLNLEDILNHCTLEIPHEYEPGTGWITHSDLEMIKIHPTHRDLVEKILKYAWLYTENSFNVPLYSFVSRELTAFETGMKLAAIHQQQIKAGKKKRPWKELDTWLFKKLKTRKTYTQHELWVGLPESHDGEQIYRSGEKLYCSKNSRNPISFRAFCDHFRKIKASTKYG